jgi:hypothetical protein
MESGKVRNRFSLTPRFSAVQSAKKIAQTVSTVSRSREKPLKAAHSALFIPRLKPGVKKRELRALIQMSSIQLSAENDERR